MTAATFSLHSLTTDLRTIVAAGIPTDEWPEQVAGLIGRPLSMAEKATVFQALGGYKREPWADMWADAVRRLARLLIAGGLA